ncbi:hypothetical protein [Coleofasciculus sp. G2-EDA-02]|uniref:hypothetical protein n=1 Tax=Coleofasciculus sp. G2-EDA-02 TaxID=3069529 RepID=UPI0032FB9046
MDQENIFDQNLIDDRKIEFCSALKDQSQTDKIIVQKYITCGTPYYFKDNENLYFNLKHEVSSHFSEHPDKVRIVGSAKLGFSIAPQKMWKSFSLDSDIDVVIISEVVFKEFWYDLYNFNIGLTSRTERENKQYRRFLGYFF